MCGWSCGPSLSLHRRDTRTAATRSWRLRAAAIFDVSEGALPARLPELEPLRRLSTQTATGRASGSHGAWNIWRSQTLPESHSSPFFHRPSRSKTEQNCSKFNAPWWYFHHSHPNPNPIHLPIYLYLYLSVYYLSVCWSICLSVCLSLCMSAHFKSKTSISLPDAEKCNHLVYHCLSNQQSIILSNGQISLE